MGARQQRAKDEEATEASGTSRGREVHRTWGYQPGWQPQDTKPEWGKGQVVTFTASVFSEKVGLDLSRAAELGVPEERDQGHWRVCF